MPLQDTPDDEELVHRCAAGDGTAWPLLVRRYERLVYAIARRGGLGEQDAADVFQTVFLRLLRHLPRLAEPSKLQAWLVTTTKREMLTLRYRTRRMISLDDTEPGELGATAQSEWLATVDESPGPQERLERWQLAAQVWRVWERMDDSCRNLLQMLFVGDPPAYEEVSRQLGMPVGSIGPTRARCLAKLRRLVEQPAVSDAPADRLLDRTPPP